MSAQAPDGVDQDGAIDAALAQLDPPAAVALAGGEQGGFGAQDGTGGTGTAQEGRMDRGHVEVEHGGVVEGGRDPLRAQGRDPVAAARRVPVLDRGHEGSRALGLLLQDGQLVLARDHQDAQRPGQRHVGEARGRLAIEGCRGGGERPDGGVAVGAVQGRGGAAGAVVAGLALLLEQEDAPRRRQRPGERGAGHAGAHDDDVELFHRRPFGQAGIPSSAKLRNGTGSPGRTAVTASSSSISPPASTIEVRMPEPSRAMRWAASPPAASRVEPAAQILAAARALAHGERRRHRQAQRRAPGKAREAGDDRPGEQEKADHRRHGIARQADEHGLAQAAEGQRPAGLHGDLPEIEPPVGRHGPDHMVLVAARGAARGEQHVVGSGGGGQDAPDGTGLVGGDAEVGDLDRQGAQQGLEDRPVGVVDAARAVSAAGCHQLVAGGQDRHAQRREHRQRGKAELGGETDLLRPQADARPEHGLARAHVLAGPAPVGAELEPGRDDDGPVLECRLLLQGHGVGTRGHHGTGQDAQGGTRRQLAPEGVTGRGPAGYQRQPGARLAHAGLEGEGETVDGGIVEGRHVARLLRTAARHRPGACAREHSVTATTGAIRSRSKAWAARTGIRSPP